jgi:tRNA dimethylallyltransferase
MQVYRGMDVGTAKQPPSSRRVPYHCVDIADPGTAFSAALYQKAARAAIADCMSRGVVPILCGGTGLYVRAAVDAFDFPAGEQTDNPVRESFEILARDEGSDAAYALLRRLDPDSAALIHPNNVRRVVRALEMHAQGDSYAVQHAGFVTRESVYDLSMVGLTMEREALYRRVDERVDRMIANGLVEEVHRLLEAGFREALTAAQAIGYKEIVPVLDGLDSLDDAVESIKRSSRRYAKRQLTWFRADPRVMWFDVTDLSPAQTASSIAGALHLHRTDTGSTPQGDAPQS